MTPSVSIITVNYNEPEETDAFLASVYASDTDDFEVIVVDNGSKNKVSKSLEESYSRLTCLILEDNLGFAGGNNVGVKEASGKYLLFLNNDTLIPTDFISKMLSFIQDHPHIGMLSPKIVYPDGVIQYGGAVDIHPMTGRGKRLGLFEKDSGQYDDVRPTDLPHGAAMMVPMDVIKEVGEMPEDYFLYYEEHDWCMMVKRAGRSMYYFGETHVIHKESVSVGIDSPLKVYYMNRNRLLFQVRNFKGLQRWSGILFYCFLALPKSSINYLLKGRKRQLVNLWRGVFWHLNKRYVYKA